MKDEQKSLTFIFTWPKVEPTGGLNFADWAGTIKSTIRFNFAGNQIGYGYYQVEQVQYIAKQLLDGELFINTNEQQEQHEHEHVQQNNNVTNHNDDDDNYIELSQTTTTLSQSNNTIKTEKRKSWNTELIKFRANSGAQQRGSDVDTAL